MSRRSLSDEEIYSGLEKVINTIIRGIPMGNQETSSFPDQQIMEQLKQHGYNAKTSWAFLRACYWYLADREIMVVDPSNRYYLREKTTEEKKTDLRMEIFSEYETYLKANYANSLNEPTPFIAPTKVPESSPGFQPKYFSGGK